jgi:adenine-specific DNA-methyltransferase
MHAMKATPLGAGAIRHDHLLERVDVLRVEAHRTLTPNRAEQGQFFTPQKLARFMARMFAERPSTLHILDAGAGIGSLSAALVVEASQWVPQPSAMTVTAYEIDPTLGAYLQRTLDACQELCRQAKISFAYDIVQDDFIRASVEIIRGRPCCTTHPSFNAAILNPPYRKIHTASTTHRLLQQVGVKTTNMYAAFLWLAIRLMEPNGELVALTPRSFCNGPYFLPFRKALLETMSIHQLHIFDERDRVFAEDDVVQEHVIVHATKSRRQGNVIISSSADPDDPYITVHHVEYHHLVYPDDPNGCIHIVPNGLSQRIGQQARRLRTSLDDIGITVSTGKVVDFRARDFLTERPDAATVPLLYPRNVVQGYIAWPNGHHNKPSAIRLTKETEHLLVPAGWYVLVKRFSAKEEKRRIVAAVCDPARVNAPCIGIENHVNYYHQNGKGLPPLLAKGLAAFLNSTLVDEYVRQLSGHTQVNAADLRSLKYPSLAQILALGEAIGDPFPTQEEVDHIVLRILGMDAMSMDVNARKKIEEARNMLRALQIPKAQLNQHAALTLLALLDMKPNTDWSDASNPLRGIPEMMDYVREHFGIAYAPNPCETVRRGPVHQFVHMGFVVAHPDDSTRPVHCPTTRYQIHARLLKVIRTYGTSEWDTTVSAYLANERWRSSQ